MANELLVTGPSVLSAIKLAAHAVPNPRLLRHIRSTTPSSSSPSTAPAAATVSSLGLPLGLHFNLTEGTNISDGLAMKSKNEVWSLYRTAQTDANTPLSLDLSYIRRELCAQIERFISLVGYTPHYLDGHNHIHVIPCIAQVIKEVLPRYGIKYIRCPREKIDAAELQIATTSSSSSSSSAASTASVVSSSSFTSAQLSFFADIVSYAESASLLWSTPPSAAPSVSSSSVVDSPCKGVLHSTQHFLGITSMGLMNNKQKLIRQFQRSEQGYTEYMCHPGYPSVIGDDFSRSSDRAHELSLLCNEDVLNELDKQQIVLTNWKQIEQTTATNEQSTH